MQLNDENISGFEGGGQLKYSHPHSHYSNAEPLSRKDLIQKEKAEHTVSLCFSVASKIELNKLNH